MISGCEVRTAACMMISPHAQLIYAYLELENKGRQDKEMCSMFTGSVLIHFSADDLTEL